MLTAKEKVRWQLSRARNQPFGDDEWTSQMVNTLGLGQTLRVEGRPKGRKEDA